MLPNKSTQTHLTTSLSPCYITMTTNDITALTLSLKNITIPHFDNDHITLRNLERFIKSRKRRSELIDSLKPHLPLRALLQIFIETPHNNLRLRKVVFYYMKSAHLEWYAKPILQRHGYTTANPKTTTTVNNMGTRTCRGQCRLAHSRDLLTERASTPFPFSFPLSFPSLSKIQGQNHRKDLADNASARKFLFSLVTFLFLKLDDHLISALY